MIQNTIWDNPTPILYWFPWVGKWKFSISSCCMCYCMYPLFYVLLLSPLIQFLLCSHRNLEGEEGVDVLRSEQRGWSGSRWDKGRIERGSGPRCWDTTPCSAGARTVTETHTHTHQCSGVRGEGLTTLCLGRSKERSSSWVLEGEECSSSC